MKQRRSRELATDSGKSEVEALRAEVARLSERMTAMEHRLSHLPPAAPAAAPPAEPTNLPDLPEEIVSVLSAAVAAYLGKKPRFRSIRVAGSATWAQQGRATIQASHALSVRREHQ